MEGMMARWRTLNKRKRRADRPIDWHALAGRLDATAKAAQAAAPELIRRAESFKDAVAVIARTAVTMLAADVAREIAGRPEFKTASGVRRFIHSNGRRLIEKHSISARLRAHEHVD